jgi:oxygen-dependent protoporphyrinogen oxidase
VPPAVNASDDRRKVVVVGGGITGLAAAHRLIELSPEIEVIVLEATSRAGGVLDTLQQDGFLIEHSADNFITNVPWAVDLCRRIGLADELVPTRVEQRGALVVHNGRLERVPEGFMLLAPTRIWPLLATPLLSPWGKLRLLLEPLVPRRASEADDESLASFARRRLGREAFERIVQPLVGGIYTADPEKLSLAATLPRFLEMERRHGSLIRAARAGRTAPGNRESGSGARYGLFATLRGGLNTLVAALVSRLPSGSLRTGTPADHIERRADGTWVVHVAGGEILCDGLIVTTPANHAGALLREVDRAISASLEQIEYAGTSIVSLGYRRHQIAHPLDAFGFVVPVVEKRRILAGSFSSVKFAGRAPDESVLIRVFIGGACQGDLAMLPDAQLRTIATEELAELLQIRGEPTLVDIARWPRSMPQYHLGHQQRVAAIEQAVARYRGLELAGNAYHGVGIPHCIHGGELAAERMFASLEES